MDLENIIDDIKYNCEVNNAKIYHNISSGYLLRKDFLYRLYMQEHEDMKEYQRPPSRFFKTKDESIYDGEYFENYKERKEKLWKKLVKKPYKDLPKQIEVDFSENIAYCNAIEEYEDRAIIFGHFESHERLYYKSTGHFCDIFLIDKHYATDMDFCNQGGLSLSMLAEDDEILSAIFLNKKMLKYYIWSDINYDDFASSVMSPELRDLIKEERAEEAIQTKEYKSLLKKRIDLIKRHEMGHWLTFEIFGDFETRTPLEKEAYELLADTIPGEYLSTLHYILENDDPNDPVLLKLALGYINYNNILPELNEVWTDYPCRISKRKLKRAIEKGYKRTRKILRL